MSIPDEPTTKDFPAIIGPLVWQRILDDMQRAPVSWIGGEPRPVPKWSRRRKLAHRFHMWKYDLRDRIHDRLFPDCRGERYW